MCIPSKPSVDGQFVFESFIIDDNSLSFSGFIGDSMNYFSDYSYNIVGEDLFITIYSNSPTLLEILGFLPTKSLRDVVIRDNFSKVNVVYQVLTAESRLKIWSRNEGFLDF